MTLMSADAQKVQDATLSVHALWGAPIMIIVILVFLYRYVKWATFVGLAIMLSLGPLAGRLSRVLGKLQRARVGWTDKRVGVVNEVITGIRVIKFYAWETSFMKRIQEYRNEEGKLLKKIALAGSFFAVLLLVGPVFVSIACFSSYALGGYTLSTADAYTALAFFSILRMPLSFLPMFITLAINALVALKRIQAFLLTPEAEDRSMDEDVPKGTVHVEDGVFQWESSQPKPTLRDITFSAEPGSLTMVVGSVGSGKSSLLATLIRQIDRVSGTVKVGGSIAYVAQSAWIINDTVRENIIMGKEFDIQKYNEALKASQLIDDLGMWRKGDFTEIGERGITMSGGQKQRVSIARAVYADADVYFMDDPLSAVDAHVGKALFDECLTGVLAGKTIVLVSNAIHYLPQADKVIWLENGGIKAMGDYDDVVLAGFDPECLNESNSGKDKMNSEVNKKSVASSIGHGVSGKFDRITEGEVDETAETEVSDECDHHPPSEGESSGESSSPTILAAAERHGSGSEDATCFTLSQQKSVGKANRPSHDLKSSDVHSTIVTAEDEKALSKVTNNGQKHVKAQELTGVEEREGGSVGQDVVRKYVVAFGGFLVVFGVFFLLTMEQGFKIGTDRWIGLWAEDKVNVELWTYISVYAGLGIVYGVFTFLRSLCFAYNHVGAALKLHRWLLVHLMKLPMSFFDTNPSGRIVNRFSRDLDIVDGTLAQTMIQCLGCFGIFLGILVVICLATPLFTPFLIPISLVYFWIQRLYIPSGRELQRLESITRSPIYTQFGETITGVATIRAYGLIDHFTSLSDSQIQINAAAFTTQKAASAWLSTRLDVIGLITLMLAAVLAVQGGIEPALAGLSLVYALDMTKFLKFGTQTASRVESDFNSVERIIQYLKPTIEGNEDIETDKVPEAEKPVSWPSNGAIKVKNISMRYRADTPLVVKKVTLDIKAGEKIGIAGRTGSGKSSLFLAFYRMVTIEEGTIEIDDVDTSFLKLSTLRRAMSMIPQDPFMFSGTIRLNLDPFDEYQDDEVWKALEGVGLKSTIENLPEKLLAHVVDNGGNFSQGQRQLFCLARALLRKSKILMMDEATASVDVETDALIQHTIRNTMKDTTVLTIAHRINTIMDSDKVLVMDNGEVGEFGPPQDLLEKEEGLFAKLVKNSKKRERELLGGSTFLVDPRGSASNLVEEEGDSEEDQHERPCRIQKSASTVGLTGRCAPNMNPDEFDGESS